MATQKGKPPGKKARPVKEDRKTKRIQENSDIKALQKAVEELDVKATPTKFGDLPLSAATRAGLRDSHFETLTDIQARAIPAALQGADILGASKTGSGKTLAFLVPVLEKLYRARWSNKLDGLGALIVSPTRELSVQIFEVLRKIGRHHDLSAGLITGGKDLREEAESIGGLNILVCTPGRMLQHLDQTAGLDVDNLQMLVLDEADRIMDMGFQACIDALVEHLPTTRQTLLFSATQSRKVSDLARLSLRDPQYIAVHEAAAAATPTLLQQAYVLTPLPEKLDTLYSFLRANLKSKMICFFSSGKQVRFVYEAFRSMQPGITLLHLHGRQKQTARLEILSRFSRAQHACLLATDVVARGVDIPLVDWVVQVDCPEDADTYIHRSGRTARYNSKGKAILFLDPSEEAGMVERLKQKNVPIFKTAVKERKKQSISEALQKLCFERHDIKYLAQKSFVSYTRSVHLQRDKEVFRIDALDLDGFAKSLGLAGAPQIRFRQGEDLKKIKNASRAMLSSGSEDEDEDDEGGEEGAVKKSKKKKDGQVRTKAQRMFERTNQDVLTRHYQNLIGSEDDDDDGEDEGGAQTEAKAAANGKGSRADDEGADFFSTKRVMDDKALAKAAGLGDGVSIDDNTNEASAAGKPKVLRLGGERELVIDSKRREKLIRSKKQLLKFKPTSTKLVFDDDGNAQPVYQLQDEADFQRLGPAEQQRQQFVEAEADRVRVADVEDKAVAKEKRREKRLKRKMRERAEEDGGDFEGDDGGVATVGGGHGGLFGEDGDDGLALLRSLPMVGEEGADSDASTHNNREAVPPRKKQKKRVERDSDSDGADIRKREKKSKPKRHKNKVIELDDVPDKLEDLEALATGLLDG